MTSLRQLEEEAAKASDPEVRKQLLALIARRKQGRQQLWGKVKKAFESPPRTPEPVPTVEQLKEQARHSLEKQAQQARHNLIAGVIMGILIIVAIIVLVMMGS